ncbi:MAG: DNA polymerase Y family protein [Acidimicrobiales bacterium]
MREVPKGDVGSHRSGAATRTLVIACPDWPVVACGEPDKRPVAVVAANRVVACSATAGAAGVRSGLRRRQAEALCAGLVVVAADPARDARAFEPVVAAVESFTHAVEIVYPGVCAFATRGPSRYFGGDERLAERVVAALRGMPLDGAGTQESGRRLPVVGVGVADGRFAAELAAAHRGTAQSASGVLVVAPGASREFLAPQTLRRLVVAGGPTTEMGDLVDLLGRLGIGTFGDLAALPAPSVLARFGPVGALAHRLARGLDHRPLSARTPSPDLAVAAELDPPVESLETVAFIARGLAERLHDDLARRGLAAARVLVEAETSHGERLARLWRHDSSLAAGALAERARWQIDSWLAARVAIDPHSHAGSPTAGLTLLRLTPDEVGPATGAQHDFWAVTGDRAAAERAARGLARVQGALGPEAVCTAEIVGARGPAEQVRLVPWGSPPTGLSATRARPWPGRVPAPAPATVHPRPLPAEILDATGAAVTVSGRGVMSAPPQRLSVPPGPAVAVQGWAGPWPCDERWWAPGSRRRRARSQVVTADGVARLMLRECGRWWVEATYD